MFCSECKRSLYPGEYDRELCRDCEMDVLKTEIDRLRKESSKAQLREMKSSDAVNRRDAEIERLKEIIAAGDRAGSEWVKKAFELKAEIERLKTANNDARKDGSRLVECCFNLDAKIEIAKSRAAAWKRCAKGWRHDYISFCDSEGYPIWRPSKNFHPTTEDKSDEQKTGA